MTGSEISQLAATPSAGMLERLATSLADSGHVVLDEVLANPLVHALQQDCRGSLARFHPAGVGRGSDHHLDNTIRTDQIRWLEGSSPAAAAYLGFMDALQAGLNSRLYLGLCDYECHFAHYAPGGFYRTHRDAFAGSRSRVLSTVFYLNDDWSPQDGGELLLYADVGGAVLQRVLPRCNRLVVFLSERFPHEVLPARRERHSVAGWFRVKAEQGWLRPV